MRAFTQLYETLDASTGTNAKVKALVDYFKVAPADDSAWALYFLTGRKLKRFVSSIDLRTWTLELTGIPDWLFQESYSAVGDTAECCALLLDTLERKVEANDLSLSGWMNDRILPIGPLEEEEQRERVLAWWSSLEAREIFILNKLLTGAFRVGVSQGVVTRALASLTGHTAAEISHRLMGEWQPTGSWFVNLTQEAASDKPISHPYPFYLASPLESLPSSLGDPSEWQAERKWDGIRAQLIKREGEVFLWSRGEELITERFPEIQQAALTLPEGTVVDGEVLAARDGQVLPFGVLQKRIGRKSLSKAILAEAPAILMVYDILEAQGEDLRPLPMSERREKLEQVIKGKSPVFDISPLVPFEHWDALAEERTKSRDLGVEGIMLKRRSSPYQTGRKRGDWWKWKIDPLTIDAVLIYAQAGSGRRASLFTDYTFALWNEGELVPIAKAYSGLDDEEIAKLDNWVRRHTKDRFGPVRAVEPVHVFELAFEGINASPRHRSGVAVRFPRILRWRHDKKIQDADNLATLKAMINDSTEPLELKAQANQHSTEAEQPELRV